MSEKNNVDYSLCGVWRVPNILILAIIVAISLFFYLYGITFGLPSSERMQVTIGGQEEMKKMLPAIRSALKRNIAERSEALDKTQPENFVELARLSPYFDQVRSNNPDEFFTFKNLAYMAKQRTPIPSMFNYGPFYYYQAGCALFIGKLLGFVDTSRSADYYLMNPEKMAPFYIAGRILSAIFMTLACAILFFIGYRLGRLPVAVFCSTLFCFLPMVNLAGKFIKPEASLMFFTSLVILFSIPVLKRSRWSDYILSGLFIGLAAAVKYPGVVNCTYITMFHIIRRYSEWSQKNVEERKIFSSDDWKLVAAGAVSAVAFFIVNFTIILEFKDFWLNLLGMEAFGRQGNLFANMIDAFLCYYQDGFWYTLGIPAVIVMTWAMLYNIVKPTKLWLGCLPAIVLFLYIASKGLETSDAYFMPALIPLCLISGVCIFSFKNKVVKYVLACAVIIGTFSYTLAYTQVMAEPDARIVASKWINENIPANSVICTLRYPVFYRVPVVSPQKYKLIDQFVQGVNIVTEADYYVQTSYQWNPGSFFYRYMYGEDDKPAPWFNRIKEIEIVPRAFFGLLPLKRDYRLNHYFENIRPKIIIFKANRP
jgi:hypothetical protein